MNGKLKRMESNWKLAQVVENQTEAIKKKKKSVQQMIHDSCWREMQKMHQKIPGETMKKQNKIPFIVRFHLTWQYPKNTKDLSGDAKKTTKDGAILSQDENTAHQLLLKQIQKKHIPRKKQTELKNQIFKN